MTEQDDSGTSHDGGRSMWACKECGYRPWLSEIDENGAVCPECGWSADE